MNQTKQETCKRNFLFFGIVIIVMLLVMAPASALKVSGSKYMETLQPGAVVTHTMAIQIDDTAPPIDVAVEVMGFSNAPDGSYTPVPATEDTSRYSARPFITVDKSQLHLTPGVPERVTATISVPSDAGTGGKYAIIYIHTLPDAQSRVAFLTAIVVPVLITVGDNPPPGTGQITSIIAGTPATGQPFSIDTRFTNTGSIHYYRVTDAVEISGPNGIVASLSTNPAAYAIVPGSTVTFSVPVDTPLPAGTFTIRSTVRAEDGTVLDEKQETLEIKSAFVPPPQPAKIVLNPGTDGVLESSDGRYRVTFPAGSVLEPVTITLSPVPKEELRRATGEYSLGTSSFAVTGLPGLLAKPATIQVKPSAEDRALASAELPLQLARWDRTGNTWLIQPTSMQGDWLTAQSDRMGTWVVVSAGSQMAPPQSAGISVDPMILYGAIGMIGVVAVIAGVVVVVRKRKKGE